MTITRSEEEIIDPFPEQYGDLRIGTPININLNKLFYKYQAFDMGKLSQAGYLHKNVNSKEYKLIQGGGFDLKSQEAFGIGIATSLGLKMIADLSFSSQVSYSSNVCHNKAQNYLVVCSNQSTSILMNTNVAVDDLLTCVTPDFKDMYNAIVKSAMEAEQAQDSRNRTQSEEELLKALSAFYKKYGTGFVSELHLGAYALFKGTASYKSTVVEKKQNISGGFSIRGVSLGAEAAASYSKENFDALQAGSFVAQAIGVPIDSPPSEWINSFVNAFTNAQLSKITESAPWQKAFEPKMLPAKEVTFKDKTPDKKEAQPKPPSEIIDAAIKKMKLEEFKETYKKDHGVYPSDPEKQYGEYLKELKQNASVNDDQVNRGQVQRIAWNPLSTGSSGFQPEVAREVVASVNDEKIDFGSFGVTGYEYTEWGEVFPALKTIGEALTLSQVTMGHLMIWIAIRELFGQYLSFCTNFTDVVADGIAANSFKLALKSTVDEVCDAFIRSDSAARDYSLKAVEDKFRGNLKKEGFILFNHYQYLIDNYDWLKHIPFGAVPIIPLDSVPFDYPPSTSKYWFYDEYSPYKASTEEHPDAGFFPTKYIESTNAPSPELLVKRNAYRLYPIISTDKSGEPFFVWLTAVNEDGNAELGGVSLYSDANSRIQAATPDVTKWRGMFRSIAPFVWNSFKTITDAARYHSVHVEPEKNSYDQRIWTLKPTNNKRPQVFWYQPHWIDPIPHNPPYYVLTSVTGADIVMVDGSQSYCPDFRGELHLVPIDFKDVGNAGGNVISGGPPMWFQPRTSDLVKQLNSL